ncbi:DUF4041 domain-containing protein [Tranquillimonas alkanivorans]|uniref:SNIPE associated domain-containing protein n=1 Tax=Tranquillimonas alkanivorans TaxID=441119 RepID=A0A1I5TMM4_9RHOB|nr:DUF4041 domain-containing protein [Tranquillimonas alkanivorans]SFP83586.1 protein of unknown function [Tranquillimonas alkanivorans]
MSQGFIWMGVILIFLIGFPLFLILYLRSLGRRRRVEREYDQKIHEERRRREDVEARFAPVADISGEVDKLKAEAREIESKIDQVRATYAEKRQALERLEKQVAVYDERLAFAELGIYEPHFEFNDSETYKAKIKEVRDRQKAMVSAKQATHCPTDWTVEGSRAKGQAMINRQTRLTMRAFNNECDAAIANTRWNNVVAMEKRILNSAKQIDNANASMNLVIDQDYIALKLDELHLTHEYREQLKI